MRRLIIEEPYSYAALWSRRLALFALLVAVIGVFAARGGLDPIAVYAVLGAAALVAVAGLFCAAAAIGVIWQTGRKGTGVVATGLLLVLALLAYPAYLAAESFRLPALNDISTDIDDAPSFARSQRALDARHGYVPKSLAAALRQTQRVAYPKVQPILLDLDGDEAYQAVVRAVQASRWRIVDQTPPSGRFGVGHIDAVARSQVLSIPEDITIRLRPLAGRTRVDIRSASRIGSHDFGTNARRIEQFSADLQALAEPK